MSSAEESRMWRPPRLRVGEQGERRATWLELFYDLIFVVAVAQLGQRLHDRHDGVGVLQYVGLFVPVWWSWVGATFYANRFDSDDVGHRLLSAAQMVAVAFLAASVRGALDETSIAFALSYVGIRIVLVVQYLRAGRAIPEAAPLIRWYSAGFAYAAAIWLASVFVPTPARFWMWAIAMVIDFGTPLSVRGLQARFRPDTSHLPERFGLFVIIVLGEVVAAIVGGLATNGLQGREWLNAALGVTIALAFWWIYFENVDGSAIKRTRTAGQVWIYAHLPLVMALAATGAGVSFAIEKSFDPGFRLGPNPLLLTAAERWLLCGAVAVSLLAIGLIHLATQSSRGARGGLEARAHAAGAVASLLIGVFAGSLRPVLIMGLLAGVCIAMVVVDVREQMTRPSG